MSKKILALLLAAVMILSVGCGADVGDAETSPETADAAGAERPDEDPGKVLPRYRYTLTGSGSHWGRFFLTHRRPEKTKYDIEIYPLYGIIVWDYRLAVRSLSEGGDVMRKLTFSELCEFCLVVLTVITVCVLAIK